MDKQTIAWLVERTGKSAEKVRADIAAAKADAETTGEFDPVDYAQGGDGKVYED